MIERFSYSSLETFKKCPAQFKFRYIDKIIKHHEGIESFVGKRVHEALEFLYNEKLSGRLIFYDGVIEKYHQNWKENWHDKIVIVMTYVIYHIKLGPNKSSNSDITRCDSLHPFAWHLMANRQTIPNIKNKKCAFG